MDFLYAGVLFFFLFYLSLFIKSKRSFIKEIEKFDVPEPGHLWELYRSYGVAVILIAFILYFLFR